MNETQCPMCDGPIRTTVERDEMPYGATDPVTIVVDIPVHHCDKCGFSFTGARAEEIRDNAAVTHRALAAVQKKLDEAYKALFYVGVHDVGHMPPVVMRQVEIARIARAAQEEK